MRRIHKNEKHPGTWALELFELRGDTDKQKQLMDQVPESMKDTMRVCYKRELIREQRKNWGR